MDIVVSNASPDPIYAQIKDQLKVPRAVSWYWVCVDVVLGGCALLVLAPASVRQGPGVG